jgi:hypothetical protein
VWAPSQTVRDVVLRAWDRSSDDRLLVRGPEIKPLCRSVEERGDLAAFLDALTSSPGQASRRTHRLGVR